MTDENMQKLHSNVDEIVEDLMKTEALTMKQRISDKCFRQLILILINKNPNSYVIDFDINKSFNDELKENLTKKLLSQLSDSDVIVKTGSGGLHVKFNRMIKCYSCSDFDIDLMTSVDETKRSLIVLPESKVRKNAR